MTGFLSCAIQILVALAAARQAPLGVGLTLMSATYLHRFAAQIARRPVQTIRMRWLDPPFEVRYGERKEADLRVHKAHDIVPHLWSTLKVLCPDGEAELVGVAPQAAGTLRILWRWGGIDVVATLGRRGGRRERRVQVDFCDGGCAVLDFAEEPGFIVVDGRNLPRDPQWDGSSRPVATTLRTFLNAALGVEQELWLHEASRCLGSVRAAFAVQQAAAEVEAFAIACHIMAHATVPGPDVAAWLIDNAAPEMAAAERLTFDDSDRIDGLVRDMWAVIGRGSVAERNALRVSSALEALARIPFLKRVKTLCATAAAGRTPSSQ